MIHNQYTKRYNGTMVQWCIKKLCVLAKDL